MAIWDRLFASSAPSKPPKGEYGADGDAYQDVEAGGPDINPDLAGQAKYDVYDLMRYTDPAVRANLLMYKLPVMSATWTCEPRDETPEAKLVADVVTKQFGIGIEEEGWLDVTWDESLRQAMYFLDFGSMWEELVWGDPITWAPEDAEERSYRPIVRLAPRYPRTIDVVNVAQGRLVSIEQNLPDTRPIPAEKLCWYVTEKEGASWFGTSMLRAMYGPWRLKKALLISSGIAYDRYGSGVPVVRHPPGEEETAKKIGRNYRVHERAYVTFEGPPPPAGSWDMTLLGGAGTVVDPVGLLRHYDEQISLAGLTMFSRLGVTETGSRAVGDVLADPYYLAVTGVARRLRDARQKRIVRKFVDVNFGEEVELPKLQVSKIEAKNTDAVLNAVGELSGAGWNLNYRELVDYVCEQLGIPAPPEDHPLKAEGESVAAQGNGRPPEEVVSEAIIGG